MNLIRFYRGEEPDDQGRWLRDYWTWDHEKLEATHNYIQAMFPLPERSAYQTRAATLDDHAIAEFKGDPVIQANLLHSLTVMLDFYGFALQPPATIVPAPHFSERAPEWLFPNDHNHLRITRILKCLTLCSLGDYARAFHAALLKVVRADNVTSETLCYWQDAVR